MDSVEPEVGVLDEGVPDKGVAEEERHDARIVCLGEALVDFVCERPVSSLVEADFFVPRQGGSLANIAMAAARFSDRVELIGGIGDDQWGLWLHERITTAGVDTSRFDLLRGVQTSHAFVSVDKQGEPAFAFYGDQVRPSVHAGVHLDATITGNDGVLVVGSDSLLGEDEREVTMRAVALARDQGWAVLCDPNLRPNRWDSRDEMVETISSLVAGANVVKLNESEALTLSGMISAEAAGEWLMGLGPRAVVVTRGAHGAFVQTPRSVVPIKGVPAKVVDSTGAGDSVCGVIAAGMARWLPLDDVVTAAMYVAAGVVGVWGATEGLPSGSDARALLAQPSRQK
ncbi:MAG: fructokinase [Solirubrobacterales bacterium]|jgi:fructokinase|nr:fructokinase [Solirubrobacterales bacterium]